VRFVTPHPIDVLGLLTTVAGSELGGTAVFVGSVRRGDGDGPVEAIEYSAYEDMLEAEFSKIMAETAAQWPGSRVAGMHRVGRVPVGESSVAIAAAAPHRADAFAACRYAIEQAKKRLPVWKKEIFEDGSAAWREGDQPEAGTKPKTA